ncbi:MAG: hypothetical protein IH621_15490 [Krumholzibacteria bacterium]|nr:hypothetical protein [Candidatus Krumholzibacteria bacterium]
MRLTHTFRPRTLALGACLCLAALGGCSDDDPLGPVGPTGEPLGDPSAKSVTVIRQVGRDAPAGQVSVVADGRTFTCWPFTGTSLDGTPSDPVNLVFTGAADVLAIREALLGLDGDRSAFGFPPVYPFDQPWRDCVGGYAQVTWEADAGWAGSVVQLTVGDFGPLRLHLRLFRVDGNLTLGAAHFELQIPGTADHQVLSWEIAEQLVAADLLRAGLIDMANPPAPSDPITPAPSFRTIPAMIYNGLPPELAQLIGGPLPPVSADVPLPNDGMATILPLAWTPAVAVGHRTLTHTATYDQFVPRPYCSEGPADWLYVQGDVDFTVAVDVDALGAFTLESSYTGELWVTPIDPTTGQVLGEPFRARVAGSQHGFMSAAGSLLMARDRMMTREADGPQITDTVLQVHERGPVKYRGFNRCLDDDTP